MRTLAILPMKAFAQAKQRLTGSLPAPPRRALVEAMFTDVLTALRRSQHVEGVLVVSADLEAQQVAVGHGAQVLDDRCESGQSDAVAQGIVYALELGYPRVLLVPGDVPAVIPAELDELLARDRAGAVIVPDRHGTGTNALVLAPPDVLEPGFGPDSLTRHTERALTAGIPHEVVMLPGLALDVDEIDDLAALRTHLASAHGGAAHTRGLLLRLDRSAEAPAR